MDKISLEEKKLAIETSFNELSKQRAEIDSELLRLQGEYRLLEELIVNNKAKEAKKNG